MKKKLWSQRHPFFYFLSVWEKRIRRYAAWYTDGRKYARDRREDLLPVRIKVHQSLLIRKLGNSDLQLQYNKMKNLTIAIKKIDGIFIKPGETFSFHKLVGFPTKKRGFVDGMLLSNGEVTVGLGGGLCQLSNLIHWIILHSPLDIIERYRHGFDAFPDEGRVLPFGSGATIFYNYIDYRFTNNTKHDFQLKIWLTDEHIKGELRCSDELPHSYHIYEKNHKFSKCGSKYYRQNEIWRKAVDRRTGHIVRHEIMHKNHALVKYVPSCLSS